MVSRWRIEGHAIISDDDCIADSAGNMPSSLKNDADWAYFQRHLDAADIVITGRKGHEAHPNKSGRQRLVFTTGAGPDGFSRQGNVALVDPARYDVFEAFEAIAPTGSMIAVTGGTAVFDWFAERRLFTAFHLVRAKGVKLLDGLPLCAGKMPPEELLRSIGLVAGRTQILDPAVPVELVIFSATATSL